jgi:uncharacterized protein YbaP (TraB family)
MKRKITAWLLAALLLFCLLPLSALADSQPLLYRVTDENGSEIYLFGTIHVGNEALYPLSGQVLSAMDACDILAVEVDLVWEMEHPEELLKYAMDIYYTDDTRAEDALGMELVKQAADALGMDKRLVNGMKPYAILSLLEEKAVSDAQLKAIRAEQGLLLPDGSLDDKKSFDKIEEEYQAFTRFYKKQWGYTKKNIRKNILNLKFLKEKNGQDNEP